MPKRVFSKSTAAAARSHTGEFLATTMLWSSWQSKHVLNG